MYIKQDFGFNDLMENCWSGAIDTLKTIEEHDKEEELMQLLEDAFDECPDITEINDYLWFSDEEIFEYLEISETEEEEEEEDDISNYDCFDDFCNGRDCKSCPLYFINGNCEKNFNDMKNAYEGGKQNVY